MEQFCKRNGSKLSLIGFKRAMQWKCQNKMDFFIFICFVNVKADYIFFTKLSSSYKIKKIDMKFQILLKY